MKTTATDRVSLRERLAEPIDASSVRMFRAMFGALLLIAVARFFVHGWIHEYYIQPSHFFTYYGFGWVRPWPGIGMYVHFAVMAVLAVAIMVGFHSRVSIATFGALFAYAHLCDKTNYLNHYYLIICLCALMATMPIDRGPTVPRWVLWALRGQIAVVYTFAGIAKVNVDWLIHAEPMKIWLAANSDFPVLGPLMAEPWMAHVASIAGCAFDLSIAWLLLIRRTRPYAYVLVVAFHLLTDQLFHIGMFPWIMMASSLLFLDPSWPRCLRDRLLGRLAPVSREAAERGPSPALTRPRAALLAAWFAIQILVPLRQFVYPGEVTWTEEGFNFAWNVMRMEKNGSVDAIVTEPATGRRWVVQPTEYYTRHQVKMMSTQPDLILQFAHLVASDFRTRGVREPEVRVDAMVSLNGRPRAREIDPTVDLARASDGLLPRPWILR